MRLQTKDQAPEIILKDIHDSVIDLKPPHNKKILLTFYRFASCPFCNLRIHDIVTNYEKYKDKLEVIAIFESKHETLKKKMQKYDAPFAICSDHNDTYYDAFGVEKSFFGMLKGMFTRIPSMIKSMSRGNIPLHIDSSMIRMPADFLIGIDGKIEIAYYGKDEGDHLDIDTLI